MRRFCVGGFYFKFTRNMTETGETRTADEKRPAHFDYPMITEFDSFSLTQQSGDEAGIKTTVHDGNDKQWCFIRSVRDQKISQGTNTQRSGSQFGAAMPHVGKR